jgi:translocation and assembly module TamB
MKPWTRRARRLHQVLGLAATTVLFTGTFFVSLILHGELPCTRRFVARTATWALAKPFRGKIEVKTVDYLHFDGVTVAEAIAWDATGQRTIMARGVHAKIDLWRLLRSLAFEDATIIPLTEVHIDHAEVVLANELGGSDLGIATLFAPRVKKPPVPPKLPIKLPREIRVEIKHIMIEHAWVHGDPDKSVLMDADLKRIAGSLQAGNRGVILDVERSSISARGIPPYDPQGSIDYHLRVPPPVLPGNPVKPTDMWSSYVGKVGNINITVSGKMIDNQVHLAIVTPQVTPKELHSVFPQIPLYAPFSAHFFADGELSNLKVTSKIAINKGILLVTGNLKLGSELHAQGKVGLSDLDPRVFVPQFPETAMRAVGNIDLKIGAQGLVINSDVATPHLVIAGMDVPAVKSKLQFKGSILSGQADVAEPGMPTKVQFAWKPGTPFELDAQTTIPSLKAVPRLKGALDGGTTVKAHAKFLPTTLQANMDATFRKLGKGNIYVQSGHVQTQLVGKYNNLRWQSGDVGGSGLHIGSDQINRLRASFFGPLLSPKVSVKLFDKRWTKLTVQGILSAKKQLRLDHLTANLVLGQLSTNGSVEAVSFAGKTVRVKGIKIKGDALNAEGSLGFSNKGIQADMKGNVNFASLSKVIKSMDMPQGKALFEMRMNSDGKRHQGMVDVTVQDAQPSSLIPLILNFHTRANFQNDTVALTLDGKAGLDKEEDFLTFRGSSAGQVKGSLLETKTWSELTGEAKVDEIGLDLDKLFAHPVLSLVRQVKPSIPVLGGKIHLRAVVSRESKDLLPDVVMDVLTRDFSLQRQNKKKELEAEIFGMDLHARLSANHLSKEVVKGQPEKMAINLSSSILDKVGPFLVTNVSTQATYRQVLSDLSQALFGNKNTAPAARKRLVKLPLGGSLVLTKRSFHDFPEIFKIGDLYGNVEATMGLSGTIENPEGNMLMRVEDMYASARGIKPWPLSGHVQAQLGSKGIAVWGKLSHCKTTTKRHCPKKMQEGSVEVRAAANLPTREILYGKPMTYPWSSDVIVTMLGTKIETIPAMAQLGITGSVSGNLFAFGLHKKPLMGADLTLLQGTLLGDPIHLARIRARMFEGKAPKNAVLTASDHSPSLTVSISQLARPNSPQGGQLTIQGTGAFLFKDGLIPDIDEREPQLFGINFKNYEMGLLSSLLTPVFSEVGGFFDGGFTFSLGAQQSDGEPRPTAVAGKLVWSNGEVSVPKIGQTFRDGKFTINAQSAGTTTTFNIEQFAMDATSGKVGAAGIITIPTEQFLVSVLNASTNKDAPTPIDLIKARFAVTIGKENKVPITFEGVALGDAYGKFEGAFSSENNTATIDLAIPTLSFELSDQTERKVQDLEANPDVGVISRPIDASKVKSKAKPLTLKINIGIGSSLKELVEKQEKYRGSITLRRAGMDVELQGRPQITLSDKLQIIGEIHTLEGRVVALGKPFTLEQGVVRFNPVDATNPYVLFRARWDSPDGIRLYAEYVGYLNEAKLRLRSEPAMPESQVLSILLFGRQMPSVAESRGNDQRNNPGGLAAGGGVASTVLNSLIDPVQVFGQRLETRVDTSSDSGTLLGVATELKPNLWGQVNVNTANQRTRQNQDVSSFTLDWRFHPNWSLRTTIGDRGSSVVDLIWKLRY